MNLLRAELINILADGGAAEEADDEIYYMYVPSNARASTAGRE